MWHTTEQQVVQLLSGLEVENLPLLATVCARTAREPKRLLEEIRRERMPAAYVMLGSRGSSESGGQRPGPIAMRVLLSATSLRDDDEARRGSVQGPGVFELAERVALAITGMTVADDGRAYLADERILGGEAGLIVWEQRYELRREVGWAAPTFDGVALAGTAGRVQVEPASIERSVSRFAFPGVDGVFEWNLGTRGRSIVWKGSLVGETNGELDALEAAIEMAVRDEPEGTIVDGLGRTFERCVPVLFERRGSRGRDQLRGVVFQEFALSFRQLVG
jgi:hypothetical protein